MHNSTQFNINGNPTVDEAIISNSFKDLMRSKNTSGYFSFYIDNILIKHIPLEIFLKFPLNPN